MAHNHGNRAPGRRRTEARKAKNKTIQAKRPIKQKLKEDRKKRYWKENRKYKETQEERQKELEKKPGYQRNLKRGLVEKEEAKRFKKATIARIKAERRKRK